MKRIFDLTAVLFLMIIGALPALILALMARRTLPGPAIYWSERVGRDNKNFRLPKFRTMRMESPEVAT